MLQHVRPQARPEDRPAIRILQLLSNLYCRVYHRIEIHGHCPLPRTGAGIIVSNHASGLDPLLIQSVCPRLIVWMMAREYYELRPLNWVYRRVGIIPVQRGGRDLGATRDALRALKAGRILGMFPEGKIETNNEFLPFQTGVALLAIKTRSPIFPAYLTGTQHGKEMVEVFSHRQRAILHFGSRIDLPSQDTSREALEAVTSLIRDRIDGLRQKFLARLRKKMPRNPL